MATSYSRGPDGAGPQRAWRLPWSTATRHRLAGAALAAGLLVALVAAGYVAREWLALQLGELPPAAGQGLMSRLVLLSVAAYVLIMAVPFVPGVEIGLGLLMVFGAKIAPLVYLCTVASLSLSFAIGRLVPEQVLAALLGDLGLRRAARLIARYERLSPDERWRTLRVNAPRVLRPVLSRCRYLIVLIAFNLPGNIVLGGGGGIAMMMGMSRLFPAPVFVALVSLAVLPVPLACLLLDFPRA